LGFKRGLERFNIRRWLWLKEGFERKKKEFYKILCLAQNDKSQKRLIENRHIVWRHSIVVYFQSKAARKPWYFGNIFSNDGILGN
jgi:hypothetical protein